MSEYLVIVIQLIFLEGVLSIDNAAVLGAMAASLPADLPIPWPRWWLPVSRRLDPILGKQRMAALRVGLLGAYLGRGLMLFVAHIIAQNPWLQFIGGAYLVYLAVEHLGRPEPQDTLLDAPGGGEQSNFWHVVLAIEAADLVFSLDNVVAAVALSNHLVIILLGVALGILTMRFAAGIFSALIEREPILETAAYLLVLVIGSRFILEQFVHVDVPATMQFGISVAILITTLLYAHWSPLRLLAPLVQGGQRLLAGGRLLFQRGVIVPLGVLFNQLVTIIHEI